MPTRKPAKKLNPHRGSSLDDFLSEEGIFEDVELAALTRAVALKIADMMNRKQVKKTTLAQKLGTSRAALDRLLDPKCTSITLATLSRAANAFGRRVKIDFVPA